MNCAEFLSRFAEAALDQPHPTTALRALLSEYEARPPREGASTDPGDTHHEIARLRALLHKAQKRIRRDTEASEPPAVFSDDEWGLRSAVYDLMVSRESAIKNAERLAPFLLKAFAEAASVTAQSEEPNIADAVAAGIPIFVKALQKTGVAA